MKKYSLTVSGTERLDLLNRVTSIFIQKGIEVSSVNYSAADKTCIIEITCYAEDNSIIKRICNQLENKVDIFSTSCN